VNRILFNIAVGLFCLFAAILLSDGVNASANCNTAGGPSTADVCQGWSQVSTQTGGLAGAERCFSLRLTNTAPACPTTTADETTWQVDAGQCWTLYYFDTTNGLTPPLAPNKIAIDVRFDNTNTVIRNLANNIAEPANGSTFSFCATDTGLSGGSPRAGTYRVLLIVIKDNGAAGTNYNIRSDGTASVGTLTTFDKGALRAKMIVASIARNAYPAGAMFAYGPSGDESITITSTFTQPNGDANVETMRNAVVDEATLLTGEAGATVDVDATTTLVQSFVVDSTFQFANNPFAGYLDIRGASVLTNIRWTIFASSGHGTDIAVISDTITTNTNDITIDSRIIMDSDGTGSYATADGIDITKLNSNSGALTEVFNRGETYYTEFYLFNARGELLSRTMNVDLMDSTPTVCIAAGGTTTPVANKYSKTVAIPTSGCSAAATTSGSDRFHKIYNTDQSYTSQKVLAVSSLYFIDSHIQIGGTLVEDDFPTEDATEDFTYAIATGDTDIVHLWCHVVGVRKDVDIDTSGSVITRNIKDPDGTTRASGTVDTGSDGWSVTSLNQIASTPLGVWTAFCSVSFNGNSGSDTEEFNTVVGSEVIEENLLQSDPLKTFVSWFPDTNEACATIAESYLDGTARTGNADGTSIYVYDGERDLVVDGDTPIEIQLGTYVYCFEPESPGNWLFLVSTLNETNVPIGTSNVFRVDTMTNEILDATAVLLPLLIFIALIIWAEIDFRRNEPGPPILYVVAIFAGILTVGALWSDTAAVARILLISIIFFLGFRIWQYTTVEN
jgi:hypothetical protein